MYSYVYTHRPEEGREEEVLIDIEPLAGRLVLFESERFFHEVFSSVIVTFIYIITTNPFDLMLLQLIH